MAHNLDEDIIGPHSTKSVLARNKLPITIILTLITVIGLCIVFQYNPFSAPEIIPNDNIIATPGQTPPSLDPPPSNGDNTGPSKPDIDGSDTTSSHRPTDQPLPSPPTPAVDHPDTSTSHTGSQGSTTSGGTRPKVPLPPIFHGHNIIVTLTTIPERMKYLNTTLLSLMAQSVPPTEIVLNIPYTSRRFPNPNNPKEPLEYSLTPEFLSLIHSLSTRDPSLQVDLTQFSRKPIITIQRCDDDGPATKLIPTLAREMHLQRLDSIILISDDDVHYPVNWVESIVGYYLTHPQLHYTALGYRGYCVPPNNTWEWTVISQIAISAQRVYNITRAMNTLGVDIPQDMEKPATPTRNASRFIFRDFNVTISDNQGDVVINDHFDLLPAIARSGAFADLPPVQNLVERATSSIVPYSSLPKSLQYQVLHRIHAYIETHIGYPYSPIDSSDNPLDGLHPYTVNDPTFASHTYVDIITGNNGFLLRPYYFLRHTPFLGEITRVDVVMFNHHRHDELTTRTQRYEYTTNNVVFSHLKQHLGHGAVHSSSTATRGQQVEQSKDDNPPRTGADDNTPHDAKDNIAAQRLAKQFKDDETHNASLPSGHVNIVNFGNFTRQRSKEPPEGLKPSVFYMDDIWFNGILAKNSVSRAVISSANDPYHRQKVQDSTSTLEKVPIGRAYHNNELLGYFGEYWANCPFIVPDLTISEYYLRYAAKGKDHLNKSSNPWSHWGLTDGDTNIKAIQNRAYNKARRNTPQPSGSTQTEIIHTMSPPPSSSSLSSPPPSPPPSSPSGYPKAAPTRANANVPIPSQDGDYLADFEADLDPQQAAASSTDSVIDASNIASMLRRKRSALAGNPDYSP